MKLRPEQLKGGNNKTIGSGLFIELSYDDLTHVVWTLKEHEHEKGYPSFHALYMSYCEDDPTEYTLATEVFGSWPAWEIISSQQAVGKYIKQYRDEVVVRIKSNAIKAIALEAKNGKSSYAANKLLLDKGWLDAETTKKVKATVAKKKEQDQRALDLLAEDAERLGLRVN